MESSATHNDAVEPTLRGTGPYRHIVLYDGVCGLCGHFVQFVLARDPDGHFAFLPQQHELASRWIALEPAAQPPESVAVVTNVGTPEEALLERSDAALFVLGELASPWRHLRHLRWVPRFLRDLVYRGVAAMRYRLFGKKDSCDLPSAAIRQRFGARSI